MKCKFLYLVVMLVAMVSCQLDPVGINNHKGEVDVTLQVTALQPSTRGASTLEQGASSACGAVDFFEGTDWDSVDLRYTLEVYDKAASYDDAMPIKSRMVKIVDSYEAVNFDMRLAPNRNYRFVVFADFVGEGSAEIDEAQKLKVAGLYHSIGDTLRDIEISDEAINDEATDAYFLAEDMLITDSSRHTLVLRRPYGKIRVITTDLAEVNNNVVPSHVVVAYDSTKPVSFNAVVGEVSEWKSGAQTIETDIAPRSYYTEGYDKLQVDGKYTHMTLFTDYILASAEGATPIHFSMEVQDGTGRRITKTTFDTDIPIERNHLTTVIGNMLTMSTHIDVSVDDNFSNYFTVDDDGKPVIPDGGGNGGNEGGNEGGGGNDDGGDDGGDDDGDDDDDQGGTTPPVIVRPASVQLPEASVIKELIKSMQHVKFVAKSDMPEGYATRSVTIIELGENIWAVKDDATKSVEIHTTANEFTANNDLNKIFASNTSLRDIDFGDSFNTEAVYTLEGAFKGCSNLTTINFESFDTSNVTSMTDMFTSCEKLVEVDLTPLETNGITSLRRMFRKSNLKVVDLSKMDTSNVTDMSEMFYNSSIDTIIFGGKFDTSKVTTMESMFECCRTATIDISSFDMSSVVNLQRMFYRYGETDTGMKVLRGDIYLWKHKTSMPNAETVQGMFSSINATLHRLGNIDTSNVSNFKNMFYQFSSTTSLDLSMLDTSNATDMYGMFRNCSVTSLDVSNFYTSKVTDMSYMFSGCKAAELDLSSFDTSSATDMSHMFLYTKAASIKFGSKFNTSNVTTLNSMFSGCELETVDLRNFDTSNVTTMENMFSKSSIGAIIFGGKFNTSKVTVMDRMFYSADISTLDLSTFDTSSLKHMAEMFYGCKATSINLSSFDTSNVTVMTQAFRDASNLKSIDLSSFDTSALIRSTGLFRGCASLTSIDLSNFDTRNVEKMDYMFYNCGALESITFGENFKVGNVDTMSFMFYHCSSLKSIDVSNWGEASRLYYVNNLFNGCTSLTEFDSTGFIASPTDMGYMFNGCTNIVSINLSSFTRTGSARYQRLMCDCVHLKEAVIPNFDLSKFTDLNASANNPGRSEMFKNVGTQTNNGCDIYVNEVSYLSITEKNAGGYDPTYHHFRTPEGELWSDVLNNDDAVTEE